jgi:hypothetical protein
MKTKEIIYLLQDIADKSEMIAEFETHVTVTIPKELWEQLMEATK